MLDDLIAAHRDLLARVEAAADTSPELLTAIREHLIAEERELGPLLDQFAPEDAPPGTSDPLADVVAEVAADPSISGHLVWALRRHIEDTETRVFPHVTVPVGGDDETVVNRDVAPDVRDDLVAEAAAERLGTAARSSSVPVPPGPDEPTPEPDVPIVRTDQTGEPERRP